MYAVVVFGMRLMGKRQLGELQPVDLAVTILISNIATLPIEESEVPLLGGVIPILTLVCFEVLLSGLTLKCSWLRRFLSGNPRVVIREGKIDQKELKDLRFSVDDLMEELRGSGVFNLEDVDYAILETTGKLTVYKAFSAQEVTAQMAKIPPPKKNQGPPVVIVSDGQLQREALEYCGVDRDWVEKSLQRSGRAVKDIFLMTCDKNKKTVVVPREGRKG